MVSVECVKYLQLIFGGGFVFCQVILFIILNPNSSSTNPITYILCTVPDIQIVPLSFNTSLHFDIHDLLNSYFSLKSTILSQSPLSTFAIFPDLQVIPPLDKK